MPSPCAILGVKPGQASSQAVEESLVPPAAPISGPLVLTSHLLALALCFVLFLTLKTLELHGNPEFFSIVPSLSAPRPLGFEMGSCCIVSPLASLSEPSPSC